MFKITMEYIRRIISMKILSVSFVICLLSTFDNANGNSEITGVSDKMNIPKDKSGCTCSWTPWMNSGGVGEDFSDDETYKTLRSAGYEFCQTPVDIQCYNHALQEITTSSSTVTCEVELGLRCSFLCDDYSIRVACCYCPPKATGPEFLISSQSSSGGCMKGVRSVSGGRISSVVVDECNVNDKSQSWVWAGSKSLKNVLTEQCLTVTNNTVSLDNCDTNLPAYKWKYIGKSATLEPYDRLRSYIKISGNTLVMDSTRGKDSQWLAKVQEGETSMKNMRSQKCDAISPPDNGALSCTIGEYVSSKCTFSCNHGYRLPEDFTNPSVCTDDGLFTEESPVCEKIECLPVIDSIEHGTVTCSDSNAMDSSCTFTCDTAYVLVENQKVSCTEDGVWDLPSPTCRRVVCPDVEKEGIENGSVNCTTSFYFASTCTYTCQQGYEMIGNSARSCQMDSTWDQSKPTCSKIQCPAIIASENSNMSCSAGTSYLSNCEFSCDVGYNMVGSRNAICTADKTWGSKPPTCERKTCNALSIPSNGDMHCDDGNFYNSKCSFSCDRGYRLEGDQSLQCTDEGWNYGAPTCKQITCSRITAVANGDFTCSNSEIYGSRCSFSCSHGFKLKGEETIQCTDTDWSHKIPVCEQIRCPAIPVPQNGNIICPSDNIVGSKCYMICDSGYSVPSDVLGKSIDCQLDGTWTKDTENLHCKKIQCLPIKISHGLITCTDMYDFDSTCSFTCKDGFNLLGAKEATCTSTGWDAQAPTCGRHTCSPPLARPSNGQIHCDAKGPPVCTFSCDNGYELEGKSVSRCQENETWSVTDVPICRIKKCPAYPEVPSFGNMTCSGSTYKSVCRFECQMGYSLVGEQDTTCNDKQFWDSDTPACQKISCTALEKPNFGKLTCSEDFDYKSKCTYSCDTGYELHGHSSLQCLHNASWNRLPPYCERITCQTSYSNPSNGRVTCTDENNYNSVCTFKCEDGFSLEGSKSSTCKHTGWTQKKPPVCKQITCPLNEEGIPNGARGCDKSNLYKSMCTYSCNNGYELVGSRTSNCTNEGTWSSETPKCTEINCPEIPKRENGRVDCDKSNMYGSECKFVCDDGFMKSPDIYSVKCMENRRWNPAGFPVCETKNVTVVSTPPPTTVSTTTTSTTKSTTIRTPTEPTTLSSTTLSTTTTTTTTEKLPVVQTSAVSIENPPNQQVASEVTTAAAATTTTIPIRADMSSSVGPRNNGEVITTPDTNADKEKNVAEGGLSPMLMGIIAAVAVLIIIIIVILVIFLRKRRTRKKTSYQNGSTMSYKANNRYDHTELGPLIPNGENTGVKKFGSISMDRLEMEYNRRHADDDKLFREEYRSLVDGTGTKEAGGRAKNKEKNRYTNILPFDHSRVVLPKIGIDADSDYINASFVDGYKHKGKFIAAQGPKENTIVDFWRMVWDQNVSTVIMATNLEERKELKCAKYWPTGESQSYGELIVHMLGENHLVDYTIRQFTLQRVATDVEASLTAKRNITQYHFTSWPDFGVPKSPSGILKFLRKIKHSSPTGYGPIVVHCSAGVGRTGTFICIDAMMDMISRENKIDVFSFCSQMRQQRPEMVQTEQQYIFIYQAILEHHLYGDTEVEASEVSAHIEELMERLPGNVTGMEHEFKKLTSIRIQKEHMRAGNHPANMRKNRVLLIFPYDWNRVMLPIKRGQENTDYINASYIDGYRQKDAYVATQGPLPHTTEDFWRMIWHYECASIVMLTELVERGQGKCAQYWPNEGVSTFGDIDVELVSTNDSDYYTERDFKVTNLSSTERKQLIVKQFHYHDWPEVGAPASGYSMIELVEAVQKQQQNSGNHPIVVHCSAGGGRTGAFCALSTALEQVKAEGVLDMFQIVKCLRMQRPHMVQDLEQYEFCYRAVQEYVDSMSEYYNFK